MDVRRKLMSFLSTDLVYVRGGGFLGTLFFVDGVCVYLYIDGSAKRMQQAPMEKIQNVVSNSCRPRLLWGFCLVINSFEKCMCE